MIEGYPCLEWRRLRMTIIPRKPKVMMGRSVGELEAILAARRLERRAEGWLIGLVIVSFVTLAIIGILWR